MSTKAEQTRERIIEAALALFADKGFAETTLRDIAERADVSLGLAYRYFARKEALVLALYEQLSEEVEHKLRLPDGGTVGERWAVLERTRFKVLAPHRKTLLALAQAALDPEGEVGALSPATANVRARWTRLHELVASGASNAQAGLAPALYAIDLLLVLLWTQDRSASAKATRDAVDKIARFIDLAVALPMASIALTELASTFASFTRR